MTEDFKEAYKKLNTSQKEAVDTIEGPVMVIAGPGTGKTQVLTLRIANILKITDTEPENILALTFTEAAVANMRRRLAELIGSRAYQVAIHTFHGFAEEIINRYPEDFPRIIGSRPISEVDQVAIVKELIEGTEVPLSLLRPYGDRFLYVRDIVSSIGELKREGITAERFTELVAEEERAYENIEDKIHAKGAHKGKVKGEYIKLEKLIAKNKELSSLYSAYERELEREKSYDFTDMIMELLLAVKINPSLLQILQETYQYILVDEHQDTNNAQNRILELLASFHSSPNLFIVGDEKQAIFRFQGASLENFYYFQNLYKDAKLISLSENYRSTQSILDSAESLIAGREPLLARASRTDAKIKVCEFSKTDEELYYIGKNIKEKIENEKIDPSEIAVLYRNNADAFPIARILSKMDIPYTIESDQDLFSEADVAKFLAILRAIYEYGNNEILVSALHVDLFGILPLDLYRTIRGAYDSKEKSLYDFISNKKKLENVELESSENLENFRTKLSEWVKKSHNEPLLNFLERVMTESGLLDSILKGPALEERMDALSNLFDEARKIISRKSSATLADFFTFIDTIREHNLFIRRRKGTLNKDKVRLMTVHRAKGLEFEYVYVIHAYSGHFGDKRNMERLKLIDSVYLLTKNSEVKENIDEDGNSEERRLFYVALTRAKKGVTITYARENDDGREQLPTSFIDEIKPDLIEKCDMELSQKEYLKNRDIFFRHAESDKNKDDHLGFVENLFHSQGFSPTALNNYLECPWKYFYLNLVRIPKAPDLHQSYGTAIHAALQDFFVRLKEEEAKKEFLLESFEGHLNREPIPPKEISSLLEKGKRALTGWFNTYKSTWNLNSTTEYRINGVMLDDIRLTGVLDKIEYVDDAIVNVVDYKTGKSKTRNTILGKTRTADGNYYRQLVFYKLLLNHFNDGKLSMQSGVLDFIEPDESGKYKKEEFEITDDEVRDLTELIKKTAADILSLSFWNSRCSEKDCEYCKLRDLILNENL